MFLVSSRSCLRSIHWSQVLSWERRCSWSSADRRCSNYIWVINNFMAYKGATYIRGFTVVCCPQNANRINNYLPQKPDKTCFVINSVPVDSLGKSITRASWSTAWRPWAQHMYGTEIWDLKWTNELIEEACSGNKIHKGTPCLNVAVGLCLGFQTENCNPSNVSDHFKGNMTFIKA